MNVLFIMSDQHSARALGCYGNDLVSTPSLDRLAREGARFENAICQSGQCRPSRFSLWTGRYARSHGLYWNSLPEDPTAQTVGKLFREAGYLTASLGKHHMRLPPEHHHGFDVVETADLSRFADEGTFLPQDEVHPGQANVGESSLPNAEHPAGFVTDRALSFLRGAERPFCLWYSFDGPHTPICPSTPWARQYRPDEIELPPNHSYPFDEHIPLMKRLLTKSGRLSEQRHRQVLAYYYGYVSQIDHNVGRVLDELDRLGLSSSTLVVYTSDHGEMMGEHGAWTKGTTGYEATIRVPLIVRWPGEDAAVGVRRPELVGLIDLLPTLLDAAGLETPVAVQGQTLVPLLAGTATSWRDAVFSEIGEHPDDACVTIRTASRKYVRYRERGDIVHEQFFDLATDPWEMQNGIGEPRYRADVDELASRLQSWEDTTLTAPSLR